MPTEVGRGKAIPPRGPTTDTIRERNKTAVRQILRAFNTGEYAIVDEVSHSNLVSYTPRPSAPGNRDGLKQQIAWIREQFPDVRFEEEEILAEGDVVYLRWRMTGTHQGRFLGRAPTGKQITLYGHEVVRLQDGKIIEHRDVFDMMAFLDKLGLLDADMLQQLHNVGLRSRVGDLHAKNQSA